MRVACIHSKATKLVRRPLSWPVVELESVNGRHGVYDDDLVILRHFLALL